jgi:hypothetical protein
LLFWGLLSPCNQNADFPLHAAAAAYGITYYGNDCSGGSFKNGVYGLIEFCPFSGWVELSPSSGLFCITGNLSSIIAVQQY